MLSWKAVERRINQDSSSASYVSLDTFLKLLKTLPEHPELRFEPPFWSKIDNFLDLTNGECKTFLRLHGFTDEEIEEVWDVLSN